MKSVNCPTGMSRVESRLLKEVGKHLLEMPLDWNNFNAISDIAFNYKINELIGKVMSFIDNDFDNIVDKDINQLSEMNDSTHNKLLELLAKNYSKLNESNKILKCGKCESCKIINLDVYITNSSLGRCSDFYCKLCNKRINIFMKDL